MTNDDKYLKVFYFFESITLTKTKIECKCGNIHEYSLNRIIDDIATFGYDCPVSGTHYVTTIDSSGTMRDPPVEAYLLENEEIDEEIIAAHYDVKRKTFEEYENNRRKILGEKINGLEERIKIIDKKNRDKKTSEVKKKEDYKTIKELRKEITDLKYLDKEPDKIIKYDYRGQLAKISVINGDFSHEGEISAVLESSHNKNSIQRLARTIETLSYMGIKERMLNFEIDERIFLDPENTEGYVKSLGAKTPYNPKTRIKLVGSPPEINSVQKRIQKFYQIIKKYEKLYDDFVLNRDYKRTKGLEELVKEYPNASIILPYVSKELKEPSKFKKYFEKINSKTSKFLNKVPGAKYAPKAIRMGTKGTVLEGVGVAASAVLTLLTYTNMASSQDAYDTNQENIEKKEQEIEALEIERDEYFESFSVNRYEYESCANYEAVHGDPVEDTDGDGIRDFNPYDGYVDADQNNDGEIDDDYGDYPDEEWTEKGLEAHEDYENYKDTNEEIDQSESELGKEEDKTSGLEKALQENQFLFGVSAVISAAAVTAFLIHSYKKVSERKFNGSKTELMNWKYRNELYFFSPRESPYIFEKKELSEIPEKFLTKYEHLIMEDRVKEVYELSKFIKNYNLNEIIKDPSLINYSSGTVKSYLELVLKEGRHNPLNRFSKELSDSVNLSKNLVDYIKKSVTLASVGEITYGEARKKIKKKIAFEELSYKNPEMGERSSEEVKNIIESEPEGIERLFSNQLLSTPEKIKYSFMKKAGGIYYKLKNVLSNKKRLKKIILENKAGYCTNYINDPSTLENIKEKREVFRKFLGEELYECFERKLPSISKKVKLILKRDKEGGDFLTPLRNARNMVKNIIKKNAPKVYDNIKWEDIIEV